MLRKRNYESLKKGCLEDVSSESRSYSELKNSFKKLKLLEQNNIVPVYSKSRIRSLEKHKLEKPKIKEKCPKEYEDMNNLLRNSYYEYLYKKKDPPIKTERNFEKIDICESQENDIAQIVFDYYKEEKDRLYQARTEIEMLKKKMDLE